MYGKTSSSFPLVSLKKGTPSIPRPEEMMMQAPPSSLRAFPGSQRCRQLRRIDCARCGTPKWICYSCYRGHKYCGQDCAQEVRRESSREASSCYVRTEEGRAKSAESSARYRERRRKGVTQQSLPKSSKPPKISTSPPIGCCAVCAAPGRRVDLRRIHVGRARRTGFWKRQRRKRTEFLSWSTINWSFATRICVSVGRKRKDACSRAWSRTVNSFRWWSS